MLKQIVFVVILAILANYIYVLYNEYQNSTPVSESPTASGHQDSVRLFTYEELKATKSQTDKLYLAILGKVYDVTQGAKHYGPGGSYDFFVGVDASRAFTTGKFEEDLNDNIDDLDQGQIANIFNWQSFFDKTYTFVGKLKGRFYDENGEPTPSLINAEKANESVQHKEKLNMEFHKRFPSCNSEWSQDKGGLVRVWCSTESGGVKRSWIGYPRLVHNPHTKTEQCACVNEDDLKHPSVKPYEKCNNKNDYCQFL